MMIAAIAVAGCQARPDAATVTAAAAATVQVGSAAPVVVTAGALKLSISSPADETVVTVPQVDVVGQAPPETVISINDTIVVVGASGQFSTTIALQDGPNELAIVASNPNGEQVSSKLVVTYEPPG